MSANGGPAFPCVEEVKEVTQRGFGSEVFTEKVPRPGMSLRDYLAARAIPTAYAHMNKLPPNGWGPVAECSYEIADAMLKARGTK